MRWLSSWSAPLHVPAKDDAPPCERCRHPARAHNGATSCSVQGFWGRRCRCSGYVIAVAADDSTSSSTATIFISHAHEDDDIARQLKVALDQEGIKPWLDAQELCAGDELLDSIGQALAKVDYFALLLSRAALTKRWVLAETRMALSAEIEAGRPRVLVLLLEDCEVPIELKPKKFLDFRGRFDSALAELVKQLKGVDLSITTPKQTVVAEIIANADAEFWQQLQAGSRDEWQQDEAANLIRYLRSDELEAAVALAAQWPVRVYKRWERDLLKRIRRAANVNDVGARRIIGRLSELGFLKQATDLDYSQERSNAWRKGSMLWILERAARPSGLFPVLPPPVPERLSSLLAYDRPINISGVGWHAVRFRKPVITSVDLDQPVIVAVSRHANPERSWAFRSPDDRTPLISDYYVSRTELVPGNRFACSGEIAGLKFDLSAFDDLGLLCG